MPEMKVSTIHKGQNLTNKTSVKGNQRQLQFNDELEADYRGELSGLNLAFSWINLDNLAWMFLTLIKDKVCWKLAFNTSH